MSKESFDRSLLDNKGIIIFDGECAFCNASVVFVRKHNSKDNLLYCASQSEAAKNLISHFKIKTSPKDSLIFIKGDKHYIYSSAALKIAKELDRFWSITSFFLIVPKFIRDSVYKFIAKRRKLIMGSAESCSLDSSELFKDRILA